MSRILEIKFTADEEHVGGILADLGERVHSLDFGVVELRDGRSSRRKTAKRKAPSSRKRAVERVSRKGASKRTSEATQRRQERITSFLSAKGPHRPGKIQEALGINGSALYWDLSVLKKAHKVRKNAAGQWEVGR